MLSTLICAGLMLPALRADQPPELKGVLAGEWKLRTVEINAQALSMEKLQEMRLAVRGEQYVLTLAENRLAMTYKLLPNERPPAMDLTVVEGPDKGKTYPAIYKLEGETLTVCRNIEPGKQRPTEFATRPDTGLMLAVWTRQPAK
jgi:uncharacterized protein (TIGR03067 family)